MMYLHNRLSGIGLGPPDEEDEICSTDLAAPMAGEGGGTFDLRNWDDVWS